MTDTKSRMRKIERAIKMPEKDKPWQTVIQDMDNPDYYWSGGINQGEKMTLDQVNAKYAQDHNLIVVEWKNEPLPDD